MTTPDDARSLFDDINARLSNGWHCRAVSTLTPGVVRLQLSDNGIFSDIGFRACVEGKTLEKAIEKAAEYTAAHTPQEVFTD